MRSLHGPEKEYSEAPWSFELSDVYEIPGTGRSAIAFGETFG
jgi:hypothetical protein